MALKVPFNAVGPAAAPVMGSPSVAASTANAGASLAGAVNDLAVDVWQMGEAAQKVKNDKKLSEMQLAVQKAAVEYQNSLIGNNDPTTWVPGYTEAMSKATAQFNVESLPPDVRDNFLAWNGQFQAKESLKLGRDAQIFSIEEAKVAANNNVDLAVRRNDFGEARNLVNGLTSLSPAEKQQRIIKLDNLEALHLAKTDVETSPREALARLEAKNADGTFKYDTALDLGQRDQLAEGAKRQIQKFQHEATKKVKTDIAIGNITSEEQLKERLGKESYIEEALHDEMIFHFQQKQPLDQETRFALVDSMNDLHDSYKNGDIDLENYRTAHDALAQQIYAFGTREGSGELRERLNQLDPLNWDGKKLKGVSGKDERMRSVEKISKMFEDSGAFGKVSEEDLTKLKPFEVADKQVGIYEARRKIEAAMESWLKSPDGQKATEEQINDRYKKIFIDQAASKIMRPGGAWATQPEVEDYIKGLDNPENLDDPKGASSKTSTEPVGGNLKEMVKHFEAGGAKDGFHAEAYWDYGQWSIGYGTRSRQGEVIDRAEAEKRLDSELSVHRKRVDTISKNLGIEFNAHEKDALTSFDYNTGKLETLLAGGSRSKAEIASKMLLYNKAKGKRLAGLDRRRMAERTLFVRGYKQTKKEVAGNPEPETAMITE